MASGIAILHLEKKHRIILTNGFESMSRWLAKILDGVLTIAPIGIFSLGCDTMSNYEIDVIRPMAKFVGTACGAGLLQLLCVYPLLYFIICRKSPFGVMKKLPPVWVTPFSTRSTNAVLPVSLDVSKKQFFQKRGYDRLEDRISGSLTGDRQSGRKAFPAHHKLCQRFYPEGGRKGI